MSVRRQRDRETMGKRLSSGLHEGLAAELAGLRLASLGYKDVFVVLFLPLG